MVTGMRTLVGLGVILSYLSYVAAVAVMSVDLGSEWMKVAVVSVSSLPSTMIILEFQGPSGPKF